MNDRLEKLLDLLRRLKESHLYFDLGFHRDNSIMVKIAIPGERWEVELMEDGSFEIEIFRSVGVNDDERVLSRLFVQAPNE